VSLLLNERPVYGSSRLGSYGKELQLRNADAAVEPGAGPVQPVDVHYELTDHLGNVTTVVTGRLLDGAGGGTLKQAELVSAQGYEAFGSLLPGRNYSSGSYRFGFNGQEKDDEVFGATGTSYTADFWQYDSRTGRRWNIDPVVKPHESSYLAFSGNPIYFADPNGANAWHPEKSASGDVGLVADAGDNTQTLVDYFGGNKDEAGKGLKSKVDLNADQTFEAGQRLELNVDNISNAFKHAQNNPDQYTDPAVADNFHTPGSTVENQEKFIAAQNNLLNYNCSFFSAVGTKGRDITSFESYGEECREMGPDDLANVLNQNYAPVSPGSAVPFKTIIAFGDQHAAIYAGTHNGTVFVVTKNGWADPPRLETLDRLTNTDNYSYGGAVAPPKGATGNGWYQLNR